MMRRGLLVAGVLVLVMAVSAGCGGDDDDDAGSPTATTASAATATTGGGAATQPSGDGEGDAEAGKALAQASCLTCHSIDGSQLVGPTWKGLYGHEVQLESGETVTADDAYIRESILDPNKQIVKGFPAAMPTFNGILTDAQITDIIAYIRTLQ